MRNSIFIKIQTVPLLEQIEQSDGKGKPHLEICPNTLLQVFQFTDLRQKRKDGFDNHSVVPFAAPTQFQVFRRIDFPAKTDVCQNDHFIRDGFDERQKFLIRNIRRFNLPTGDESELVCQKAEFFADNPFPRSKAFLADALSTGLMNFADRMTQLDAVRIDDTENCRLRQELISQSTMCFQTPEESGALRQSGKQIFPVSLKPAIKSVLRTTFESKQQTECDKFAQGKFGLNMFVRLWQHIVYTAKKFYDKVFLSHGICFLCKWFRHQYSRNFSVTFSTSTIG